MSRIALVGPGAIGVTFGAAAAQAGHEVLVCSRQPLPGGVHVERDDGHTYSIAGPALTDPADAPQTDIVLLGVKAHQTAGAAAWLHALNPTTVLVLQNGIEQEATVRPFVSAATTVVPAVVWCPATVVGPGRVRQREGARLTLPPSDVAALFDGSFAEIETSNNFASVAWHKLAQNAVAGLQALLDRPVSIFTAPAARQVVVAMADEILQVALEEGVGLPESLPGLLLARFASLPSEASTSIRVDRQLGRPLEWDARNGVIVRLAAQHGVPVPVNAVVAGLLQALSETG